MDRSFRIYLLAVCFVSVVCIAITAGIGLYSLLKITAPELTLDTHSYNAHQSLDNFRNSHFYANRYHPQALFGPGVARPLHMRQAEVLKNDTQPAAQKPLADEEVERLRLNSYQMLIKNHKRSAMQGLIRTALVLFVSCILFLVHWRLIRKYDNAGT